MSGSLSNKSGKSVSGIIIEVESSDSELDEAWEVSPKRNRENATVTSANSTVTKPKDHRRPYVPIERTLNNSVPPLTFATSQSYASTETTARSATSLESPFKKLAISGKSPTKETRVRQKVIVIGDSDEEASTDIEPVSEPVKPSYSQHTSFTDSFSSSSNSLFTPISATSSFSSVASSSKDPKETSSLPWIPTRVDDLFNSPSPENNVTTRRTPRTQTKIAKKLIPVLPVAATDHQDIDIAVTRFARSSFCTDLEQSIIAHCTDTQRLLDEQLIAWGTQFELARGVSTGAWSWADVRANISKLQGNSADAAHKVINVMRGKEKASTEVNDLALWKELDREQAAIVENAHSGLGLGKDNWYGGKIQQLARLTGGNGNYKIILEPMEKRRSHRFARFCGSRRLIQLRIAEETLRNDNAGVIKFLARAFVLCGRVFVPFHSKEGSLYMVETNQDYGRSAMDFYGDQYRMPFHGFINWHNPLEEPKNYNQTITKYGMRYAIGLSNSVPALVFEIKNIMFIDDITSENWPKGKPNPPAESLMTDGCGFMNHAALHAIVKHLGYDSVPAAVQGRIAGAKGLWVLHPEDTSDEPKIWIRNSQNKIKYSHYHFAHRIFDLLAPSRPSSSIPLSEQSIINIFSNGIPADTLLRLMEEGLEEEVAPLMEWDRPNAMVFLWDAINKCGNVTGSRTMRLSTSLNRALGLRGRDWERDNAGVDSELQESQVGDEASATNTGRNPNSGTPHSLYEYAAELIQSGFHPGEMQILFEKIQYIVKNVISGYVEKYRISIPESLGAYIMPDPFGILEENEIFYRFSKPRKDSTTGMLIHALEGPVLIGRYPIMLGSDMKKVTACYYRELEKYQDIVIISTKGSRSLANELAGGDMDGDEVIVIWREEIVAPFKNTPLVQQPKNFMNDNFQSGSKVESVRSFCCKDYGSARATSEAFLTHLLANLNDSSVGLYSMMHKNATIGYGYNHPDTVRLAYIFTTLLDASKTGHKLNPGIKKNDLNKYSNSSSEMLKARQSASSRNILELLKTAALKKQDELFKRYQEKKPVKDSNQDKDLKRPYDDIVNYALQAMEKRKITGFLEELSIIKKHVDAAKALFISACAQSASNRDKQSPVNGKPFKKVKSEDVMLECAKAYAEPIDGIVLLAPNLKQVMASYAYILSPRFAFTVAFQELCHIKATASLGGHAPSLRIFDDAKTISTSFLRALKAVDEENLYS